MRCCYHGWLYDVDGTLLETPLEPSNSPIRKRAKLGAYPVREHRGLVFAYMGPPDRQPELPIYDTFVTSDTVFVNAGHHFETNWFHLVENNFDMAHTVYLHTIIPGNAQFYDSWGVLPQMEYVETPIGYRYTYSRRVEDFVWVGLEDIVFPTSRRRGRSSAWRASSLATSGGAATRAGWCRSMTSTPGCSCSVTSTSTAIPIARSTRAPTTSR